MKAFPVTKLMNEESLNGMDLRDYFAAKAMQGLVGRSGRNFTLNDLKDCYTIADEMLKMREQK